MDLNNSTYFQELLISSDWVNHYEDRYRRTLQAVIDQKPKSILDIGSGWKFLPILDEVLDFDRVGAITKEIPPYKLIEDWLAKRGDVERIEWKNFNKRPFPETGDGFDVILLAEVNRPGKVGDSNP